MPWPKQKPCRQYSLLMSHKMISRRPPLGTRSSINNPDYLTLKAARLSRFNLRLPWMHRQRRPSNWMQLPPIEVIGLNYSLYLLLSILKNHTIQFISFSYTRIYRNAQSSDDAFKKRYIDWHIFLYTSCMRVDYYVSRETQTTIT